MKNFLFFLLGLLGVRYAKASFVALDNNNSPTAWSSGVLVDQDVNVDRPARNLRSFELNYIYASSAPDSTSPTGTWIGTDEYRGGLNWAYGADKEWASSLVVDYSNEAVEKFTTAGVDFTASRKFTEHLVPKKDAANKEVEESFAQDLVLGLNLGFTSLDQKTKNKIGRNLSGELTEPQLKTGVRARYDILDWFAASSEYNGYKYNSTISAFISYLNATHSTKTTGISTAIGQLNVFDWTSKLMFYVGDWDLTLLYQTADSLTTGQTSYIYEASANYHVNKSFEIELAIGQVQPVNELEGSLNLTYNY